MPEVNRVLLSGRLTRDPDLRYAADGTHITSFPIAFHRRYRGRDGSFAEQTGYVTVMTYQRLAEVCGQYLKKGIRCWSRAACRCASGSPRRRETAAARAARRVRPFPGEVAGVAVERGAGRSGRRQPVLSREEKENRDGQGS